MNILGIARTILEAIWGVISGQLEKLEDKLGVIIAFVLDQE